MGLIGALIDLLSISGAPHAPGLGTGIAGSAGPALMGGGPGGPEGTPPPPQDTADDEGDDDECE